MSVYACLGSDASAIRDAFLTRLQSRIEDMRIKVMILDFLTVAVETQPGLIELFLNLEVKDGSDGCKVRDRAGLEVVFNAGFISAFVAHFRSWVCSLSFPGVQLRGVELPSRGPGADGLPAAGALLVPPPAAAGHHRLPPRPVAGPPRQRHAGPPEQVSGPRSPPPPPPQTASFVSWSKYKTQKSKEK